MNPHHVLSSRILFSPIKSSENDTCFNFPCVSADETIVERSSVIYIAYMGIAIGYPCVVPSFDATSIPPVRNSRTTITDKIFGTLTNFYVLPTPTPPRTMLCGLQTPKRNIGWVGLPENKEAQKYNFCSNSNIFCPGLSERKIGHDICVIGHLSEFQNWPCF